MHGGLTLTQSILATIGFVSLVGGGILVAFSRRESGEQGADDIPHGDVIHVPFGATPRPLCDPQHDGGDTA